MYGTGRATTDAKVARCIGPSAMCVVGKGERLAAAEGCTVRSVGSTHANPVAVTAGIGRARIERVVVIRR